MYSITPDITEEFVLKHLSQEQIMEHYLGLPIKLKTKFKSPFRNDNTPSCAMTYRDGRLIFTDFGGDVKGTCFHIVMHRYRCNFYEALKIVAEDFSLTGTSRVSRVDYSHLLEQKEDDSPATIAIRHRAWSHGDKDYWFGNFCITRKILQKYNVFAVETAWVNGKIIYNYYGDSDPCYAYRLREGEYKLYFPKREKGSMRFIHNTQRVQGYRQLPEKGDYLVLTKSLKDVMVLDIFGVPAVALPSETTYPKEEFIKVIKGRFTRICTLYDFDYAGIKMANFLKRRYNFKVMMFDPHYGVKDLAEYIEAHGKESTQEVINEVRGVLDQVFGEEDTKREEIPFW